MTKVYAILGGSGFNDFDELKNVTACDVSTPYGDASSGLVKGELNHHTVYFMPRHGRGHKLAPHNINYRANIYRLKDLGVTHIIAINAVGGIAEFSGPGSIIVPDQMIDYTYGRKHTFYDGPQDAGLTAEPTLLKTGLDHIDFTHPFSVSFRDSMLQYLRSQTLSSASSFCDSPATYACTQGPRLESAAEIQRIKNDGCDIVGMTAMPEAALAKELSLEYLSLCISVNWAAGLSSEEIKMDDIIRQLECSIADVKKLCVNFFR